MKYALDSCVGIKWLFAEVDSDKALRIRDDFCAGVHTLLAPDVYPVEVSHSLTRAERQGRITPAEGLSHFQDMLAILPDLHGSLSLLPRAYEISSAIRIGIYDCLYIALAEREGCKLLTADDRLVKNHQAIFPFIISLASLP